MVTDFIMMGVTGLSFRVCTSEIFTTVSKDAWSLIAPNTGCFDCPPVNQSRFALSATLRAEQRERRGATRRQTAPMTCTPLPPLRRART